MQKRSPPPCLIEDAELTFPKHALGAQLAGFPVDVADVRARRRHCLYGPQQGSRSSDKDFIVTPIDPSSPEFRDFSEMPHVQALNPLAPPAAEVIRQLGTDSLFYRHGETQLFACYQNGLLVGRAVASIDHRFPDADVGHFGFFEVCPEKACAAKLMQACEDWLRQRGKRRIEGPVNLNMLAGYRIQTAGFDTPAFPGEPRNPQHYAELLRELGYHDVARWQSWDISPLALLSLRAVDWLQRSKRRASRSRGYHIEKLRTDCIAEEIRKIHVLVHEIFADNYGFSAIDLAEHLQMQGGAMDSAVDISGAFLYHTSQSVPVGFSYGFCTDDVAILHTFGVTQAHRGSGAANLLFSYGLKDIRRRGIHNAIGALAKEGKSKYERIGQAARAYKIVGKVL